MTERVLLIKAKGGFGNRIMAAVTGIIVAELDDRVPVIDWRDGEYLPKGEDAYPLLFDSPVALQPSSFDERADVAPALWAGRLAEHPVDVISQDFPNDHSNPFIYRRLSVSLTRPTAAPVAVFWSYLPKLARIRGRAARRFSGVAMPDLVRKALARHFTPNVRVRGEVIRLFHGRSRPVIGVHVRYTDRKVSLDRIVADTAALRRRMPEAEIFLATDNSQVQERFRGVFDRVFVIDKSFGVGDASLHEQAEHADRLREAENALIDMWALSRCDWLVHSRHSTFSVAAALIGGIPTARQRDIDRANPKVVLKRWVQTWT
jgi:hypothetical protein